MKYIMNLRYVLSGMLLMCLLIGMNSCSHKDLVHEEGLDDYSSVSIRVQMPEPTVTKPMTRASMSDFDKMVDMNLLVSGGGDDASNILSRIFFRFADVQNGEEINGLKITYTDEQLNGVNVREFKLNFSNEWLVANQIPLNTCRFYAVANWGSEITAAVAHTVGALKGLQVKDKTNNIMFGGVTNEWSEVIPGTQGEVCRNLRIDLKRIVSMITVVMEEGKEGILNGVRVIPNRIALHNVPAVCSLGKNNLATEISADGEAYPIAWGEIRGGDRIISSLGGHEGDDALPLFMFENMQGTFKNETGDQVVKKPEAGKENQCSYIEVLADYYYVPDGVSQQYAGKITYRFYLGENILDNFDVKRNHHYQLTLTLKGMAGLVEDGRFQEGGIWMGTEKGGASWRIESDVSNAGFIGDATDIEVNGANFIIPFVKEEGKEYVIYCKSNNAESWLMTEIGTGGGSWSGTPTEEFSAVAKQDPVTKMWCIEMYAKAFTHDEWDQWTPENIAEWSVEDWLEKGYREEPLVLKEKGGKIVDEILVRQWFPLPVMEPGVTKPYNAKLYFSRFDVKNGEAFPWGPTGYHDWDAGGLVTSNLGDDENYKSFVYNKEYGFANMVALYVTDRRGSKCFAHEDGISAMDLALYQAGNSTGSSQENSVPYRQLYYYALPSKEEWVKIKQYGIEDWRFPLVATEYWTASMEGKQSYVYDYVSGVSKLDNRSKKHRVRLVYHKDDGWVAPYNLP